MTQWEGGRHVLSRLQRLIQAQVVHLPHLKRHASNSRRTLPPAAPAATTPYLRIAVSLHACKPLNSRGLPAIDSTQGA